MKIVLKENPVFSALLILFLAVFTFPEFDPEFERCQ